MAVPVLVFLSGAGAARQSFTELLTSGTLTARSAFTAPCAGASFDQVVSSLCQGGRLGVVERVDDTASLYAAALTGHHICLLVKRKNDGLVSVDGKSSDGTLLANCLDALRAALQELP